MTYPQQPGRPGQHPDQQPGYDDRRYDDPRYAPPPPAAKKRRRVWPWVLLAVVMTPILGFAACAALFAGGVAAVDQARQGGTVAIGETFTYQSGLALTVSQPVPYDADNEFIIAAGEQGYESTVTITNGTDQPVGSALTLPNATVNSAPAQQVFDEGFVTQDIAPGQQLAVPFRFKVAEGTTGPLQIAVAGSFNEPVFFTGQLG